MQKTLKNIYKLNFDNNLNKEFQIIILSSSFNLTKYL